MFLIKYTSGYIVRTWVHDMQINEVAERLRKTYSNYFNVKHEVEYIVCEDCT